MFTAELPRVKHIEERASQYADSSDLFIYVECSSLAIQRLYLDVNKRFREGEWTHWFPGVFNLTDAKVL